MHDMNRVSGDTMTAERLESIEVPGKWTELVRGHLVVSEPPGTYHGIVSANVVAALATFVRARRAGVVTAQDTGFLIATDPDTVRAPDAAFLDRDRARHVARRGYAPVAPNLVVEVLSPDDRPADVLAKAADWLSAGTELVWVIDPERREARVHRADGSVAVLDAGASLDGEGVLPGFRCSVGELLD
jgi:Uma2 family endonuclease